MWCRTSRVRIHLPLFLEWNTLQSDDQNCRQGRASNDKITGPNKNMHLVYTLPIDPVSNNTFVFERMNQYFIKT
jgi:hypothetical protein